MDSINGCKDKNTPSQLEVMYNYVVREKSIYRVINMLKKRESNYIGFVWAPVAIEDKMFQEMQRQDGVEFQGWRTDKEAPHEIQPPTYFKMNDVIYPL